METSRGHNYHTCAVVSCTRIQNLFFLHIRILVVLRVNFHKIKRDKFHKVSCSTMERESATFSHWFCAIVVLSIADTRYIYHSEDL
jgi:hypothetical protein